MSERFYIFRLRGQTKLHCIPTERLWNKYKNEVGAKAELVNSEPLDESREFLFTYTLPNYSRHSVQMSVTEMRKVVTNNPGTVVHDCEPLP